MTKPCILGSVLVSCLSVFALFNEKAVAANTCFPEPCDMACPNPCDNVCGKKKDCYLTEKSIFESSLFENRLVGKKSKSRITFHGWMLTGITANNHGATNEYGGSAYGFNNRVDKSGVTFRPGYSDASGNSYVLQVEQPSDWKVNQLWFGAKRDLTNKLDWGFRADFNYGTDSRYARNWGDRSFDSQWGSGDYFAAFPQLFFTFGTKDLFVKAGKFAGSFAYEGLAAPAEYFYTHANICYGRPLVTEGVMVEWNASKRLWVTAGWTAGAFNSMLEDRFGDNGFLAKTTYKLTKDMALTYKIFYNDKEARPVNFGGASARIDCLNTLIFTWKINKKWFHMSEVAYTDHSVNGSSTGHAWGYNSHFIRTINDKLSIGFRGEYHHTYRSAFDPVVVPTHAAQATGRQGGDLWNFTVAAHYKLTPKVTFRPEVRYDYTDYKNGFRPFGGNYNKKDQICGGASFIVMF
jgi:hypothetical protein